MAIIRPGPLAGAISGKLGGLVFVAGQGTPFVRPRPAPRSKRQKFLAPSLTFMARLVSEWRAKDDEGRQTWNTAAAPLRSSNRLGVSKRISGFQYFILMNKVIYQTKDATATNPPIPDIGLPPTNVAVDFEVSGDYTVTATLPAGEAGATWQVFGYSFFTNRPPGIIARPVFLSEFNLFSNLDRSVKTQWQDHFGAVQVGQHFMVEVRALLSGYPFPHKIRVDGIAVA